MSAVLTAQVADLMPALRRVAAVHSRSGAMVVLDAALPGLVTLTCQRGATLLSESVSSHLLPGQSFRVITLLEDLRSLLSVEEGEIGLSIEKTGLKVATPRSAYRLPLVREDDAHSPDHVVGPSIAVSSGSLSDAFVSSGATDDYGKIEVYKNFRFDTVCLDVEGGSLHVSTADPMRMATSWLPTRFSDLEFPSRTVLPEAACRLAATIFPGQDDRDDNVLLTTDGKVLSFEAANRRFVTPLSSGKFPKRSDFVRSRHAVYVGVGVPDFALALRRAAVFDKGDGATVSLSQEGDAPQTLTLRSRNGRSGSTVPIRASLDWAKACAGDQILFNPRLPLEYLQRLAHIGQEVCMLALSKDRSAIQIDGGMASSFVFAPKER